MTNGFIPFFQHSNTSSIQYSKAETFKNFWQPLNYLFGHIFLIIACIIK